MWRFIGLFYTMRGESKNQNNAIALDNKVLIEQYMTTFKTRTTKITLSGPGYFRLILTGIEPNLPEPKIAKYFQPHPKLPHPKFGTKKMQT